MNENEEDVQSDEIAAPSQGFEKLYHLLRGLTSSQEASSFYERVQGLLLLARWTGEPLTLREMSRHLDLPQERLSLHLSRLRGSGWLVHEDRGYTLTTYGRLLIFVLRIIAQPWQDGDSVSVIAHLYNAASSQELGIGPEQFFGDVVAAIEASLRRLRRVVSAERVALLHHYHDESSRNVRMADMALTLRQQGGIENDFESIARMHHAISELSSLSGQFEQHHLTLLERDLLTSGQVSLGDVQMWSAQADDEVCALILSPHLEQTIPQPWYVREENLIAAEADISGRPKAILYSTTPKARPYQPVGDQTLLDSQQQRLSSLQGLLRQHAKSATNGRLSLAAWVQHDVWSEALHRMTAALDPLLHAGHDAVYLTLQPEGPLLTLGEGSVQRVSDGTLTVAKEFS